MLHCYVRQVAASLESRTTAAVTARWKQTTVDVNAWTMLLPCQQSDGDDADGPSWLKIDGQCAGRSRRSTCSSVRSLSDRPDDTVGRNSGTDSQQRLKTSAPCLAMPRTTLHNHSTTALVSYFCHLTVQIVIVIHFIIQILGY